MCILRLNSQVRGYDGFTPCGGGWVGGGGGASLSDGAEIADRDAWHPEF